MSNYLNWFLNASVQGDYTAAYESTHGNGYINGDGYGYGYINGDGTGNGYRTSNRNGSGFGKKLNKPGQLK